MALGKSRHRIAMEQAIYGPKVGGDMVISIHLRRSLFTGLFPYIYRVSNEVP